MQLYNKGRIAIIAFFLAVISISGPSIGQNSPAEQPAVISNITEPTIGDLPLPLIMEPRFDAPLNVAEGAVVRDQAIVSIPFKYRRTAELKSNLYTTTFWLSRPRLLLKAGAVGYWAGDFETRRVTSNNYGYRNEGPIQETQIWCFFGKNDKDEEASACVQISDENIKLLEVGYKPYYLTQISTSVNLIEVEEFKIEEKPLVIVPDARFEYHFREWDRDEVDIQLFVNGNLIERRSNARRQDGSADVETPAGKFRLTQINNDRRSALVTKIAPPRPPEKPEERALLPLVDILSRAKAVLMNSRRAFAYLAKHKYGRATKYTDINVTNNFVQRKQIKPGDVVATYEMRPHSSFTQNASPRRNDTRYGPVGAPLFETMAPSGEKILCWRYNAHDVSKNLLDNEKSHCLQDDNNDGKFEILWREVIFNDGSRYSVVGLENSYNLQGTSQESPVEVTGAEGFSWPSEKLELVYTGIDKFPLDVNGSVSIKLATFEWRFSSVDAPNIKRAYRFSVLIDEDGIGTRNNPDNSAQLIISDIGNDESANLEYKPQANQSYHTIINSEIEQQYNHKLNQDTLAQLRDKVESIWPANIPKPNFLKGKDI